MMKKITQKQIFNIILKEGAISINNIAKQLNCDYYDIHPILSNEMHDICMRNSDGDYSQWVVRPYFATENGLNYICPKCHNIMKKRIATLGIYDGDTFLGCSNYPECDCLVTIVQLNRLKEFGLEDKIINKF